MKPNVDKCPLLVTIEKSVSADIYRSNVKNKKEQMLLGLRFDSSLSFEDHITRITSQVSVKKLVENVML